MTTDFLEELVNSVHLLPAEHKAASQLLQMMNQDNATTTVDLDMLLAPPMVNCPKIFHWTISLMCNRVHHFHREWFNLMQTPSKENIETLSALEIAEQMTLLDHKIFISIQSEYVWSLFVLIMNNVRCKS